MPALQQSLTIEKAFDAALIFITIVSLAWWFVAVRRGGSFLGGCVRLAPTEPRTRPFWTPLDIVLFLLGQLLIIQTIIAVWVLGEVFDFGSQSPEFNVPIDRMLIRIATAQGSLISVIVFVAVLRMRGPIVAAIGLPSRWRDLALGLKWSLLLIPGTLWISTLANQLVPYEHEVIDAVTISTDPLELSILFLSTVVLTPFLEEFLYRGLVQGSMEYISALYRSSRQIQKSAASVKSQTSRSKSLPKQNAAVNFDLISKNWRPQSLWPIVVSSLIFAGMHFENGAAPIPLFFFAVGLGWLYHQTGRLWPSIIVHAILNGFSLSLTILNR